MKTTFESLKNKLKDTERRRNRQVLILFFLLSSLALSLSVVPVNQNRFYYSDEQKTTVSAPNLSDLSRTKNEK